MELDRVRRLLLAEYSELLDDRSPGQDSLDALLVESPFAETTRDGRGVREVALGLTRTKLIVAADVLPSRHEYYCPKCLDASIESLELLSVYPLELVTLSVYRRRRRRSLKARLERTTAELCFRSKSSRSAFMRADSSTGGRATTSWAVCSSWRRAGRSGAGTRART